MLTFKRLQETNARRQKLWDPKGVLDSTFYSIELGGETGEAINVMKKLARERLGIAGSRDTKEHLAEELADVAISLANVANSEGIDLDSAIVKKFNETSDKLRFNVKL